MKVNKVLAVVLSAAVVAMTACGGNSSASGTSGTSSEDDSNKLTVWAWDQSFNIYAMKEAEKI